MTRSLVKQSDFSLGQVDRQLYSDTQAPQYRQALADAKNMFVNNRGNIFGRRGFDYPLATLIGVVDGEIILQSTIGNDGTEYLVGLCKRIVSQKIVIQYVRINRDGTNVVTELATVYPTGSQIYDETTVVTDFSLAVSQSYSVIASDRIFPWRYTLPLTRPTMASTAPITLEAYPFSILPSIDDGSIDYSNWTLDPMPPMPLILL